MGRIERMGAGTRHLVPERALLVSYPERPNPQRLQANIGLSFQGTIVVGKGFELTFEERDELIAKDPKNAERIFPYLGGKEVNTSPTQSFHRYVIDFGDMSLEEASRWPDLLELVRNKVKPERDKLRNNPDGRRLKQYWWQFGDYRPTLYRAISSLERCLVTSGTSKHLMFSWQPLDRIFNSGLFVFPFTSETPFTVLQSSAHELWVRALSATRRTNLSYATSDCFDTFPFPEKDPRATKAELEILGRELDTARRKWCVENDKGLTQLYNLNPPWLQKIHKEIDFEVLRWYGFNTEASDEEIIQNLSKLNTRRSLHAG